MAIDNANNFSSSVYYAKRNSPEIQKILLDLSPSRFSVQAESQSMTSSQYILPIERANSSIPIEEIDNKESYTFESKEMKYQTQQLSNFYSGFPGKKKDMITKINIRKTSLTRQQLTTAHIETKERLSTKIKPPISKEKTISQREMKKRALKKIQDQIITLSSFIPEKVVRIEEVQRESPKIPINQNAESPDKFEFILEEVDPFPFTNLTEWLIWHKNYPELAFMRETYDLEQVPEGENIEVFWVNILNDPTFFNTDWQIAGSTITIESLKEHSQPEWKPEWDIESSYLDGFYIFFEDVYQILSQNFKGIQNYNHSLLQFALKGLLLLNLAYYDDQCQKWFKNGTFEDLTSRLKTLDQFISQQENLSEYQGNLRRSAIKNEWYIGLICFDLIIIQSSFFKHFSQTHITEDEKIQALRDENLHQFIIEKLSKIEKYEKIRVRNLKRKLEE